jgi:5'-3' exoribonuclease 1
MGIPYLFAQYYKKYNRLGEITLTLNELQNENISYLFFDYNSLIHPCAQQILASNEEKYSKLIYDSVSDGGMMDGPTIGTNDIGANDIGANDIGTNDIGANDIGVNDIGVNDIGVNDIGVNDICVNDIGVNDIGANDIGVNDIGANDIGANDIGANDINEIIEYDIISNCINYTKLIIAQIIGNKNTRVYLVIDGVAPRSKMNQQRERRYKSHFFKSENSEKSSLWDSNKITPGTQFMEKLTIRLKSELSDCMLSDSNEPGEGEHKMMKMIREFSDINIKDSKICIYGLDADVIMLSMLNKYSDNIILVRDNNNKNSGIDYVNVKNLKEYIYTDITNAFTENKMGNNNKINMNIENIIHDYVLICFFLGNDFMHHVPSLNIKHNGINNVIKAYIKAWKGMYLVDLSKNNLFESINLEYLKDIFYNLKIQEGYFLQSEKEIEYRDKTVLSDTCNVFFYKFDNIYKDKDMYYQFYNIEIEDACHNYITGLYWILGYYYYHSHNNWTWYYNYHNTPYCSDIFNYLNRNMGNLKIDIQETRPFTCEKQLCMVLPKVSLENILCKDFLKNKSGPLIEQLFPEHLYVDLSHTEFLWQSKILFNKIDDNLLDLIL